MPCHRSKDSSPCEHLGGNVLWSDEIYACWMIPNAPFTLFFASRGG